MSSFIHLSGTQCKVCSGERKDCRQSIMTGLFHCRARREYDFVPGLRYVGQDSIGFQMWSDDTNQRSTGGQGNSNPARPVGKPKSSTIKSARRLLAGLPFQSKFEYMLEHSRPMQADEKVAVELFEDNLGLGRSAIHAMAWRFARDQYSNPCWIVPEHRLVDGELKVVAVSVRYPDWTDPSGKKVKGSKITHGNEAAPAGSRRGIFIPTDWSKGNGPLLMPEGVSCGTAARWAGLLCLARMNNGPTGVETVVHLWREFGLEEAGRPIWSLIENDQKPDGSWPALEGGRKAAELAAHLSGQPVPIYRPGGGHKDLRDWMIANKGKGTHAELGQRFLAEAILVGEPVRPDEYVPAPVRQSAPVHCHGGDGASEPGLPCGLVELPEFTVTCGPSPARLQFSADLDAACEQDEIRHPLANRVEISVIDPAQAEANREASRIRQEIAERHRDGVAELSEAGMRREKCGCVPIALRDPSSGYGMRGRTRCKTWGCTCCALEYRKREFIWKGTDAILYQTSRAGHGPLCFRRHDGPGGRLVMPDRPNATPRLTPVYRIVVDPDDRKPTLRRMRNHDGPYGFATVKLCDRTIAIYTDHPAAGGSELTPAEAAREWAEDVFNAWGKKSLTMGGTWQRPDSESGLERVHCSATVPQTVAKLEEIQASLPTGTAPEDGVWIDDREGHIGVNGILREVAWSFGSKVSAEVQAEFYAWLADGGLREELREMGDNWRNATFTYTPRDTSDNDPAFAEDIFAGMT